MSPELQALLEALAADAPDDLGPDEAALVTGDGVLSVANEPEGPVRLDTSEIRHGKLREELGAIKAQLVRSRRSGEKRLLTKVEFARLAGIDRKTTLPRLIKEKVIRTVRIPGTGDREVRIPRTELERLEAGIPLTKPGKKSEAIQHTNPPARDAKELRARIARIAIT